MRLTTVGARRCRWGSGLSGLSSWTSVLSGFVLQQTRELASAFLQTVFQFLHPPVNR